MGSVFECKVLPHAGNANGTPWLLVQLTHHFEPSLTPMQLPVFEHV